MSGYPNLKTDDVELLIIKTKDDQLTELQYRSIKNFNTEQKNTFMKIY